MQSFKESNAQKEAGKKESKFRAKKWGWFDIPIQNKAGVGIVEILNLKLIIEHKDEISNMEEYNLNN